MSRSTYGVLLLAGVTALCLAPVNLWAATYYWTGGSDTSWGTLENWATDSTGSTPATELPSSADDVVFNAGSVTNQMTNIGASRSVASMTFNANSSSDFSAGYSSFLYGQADGTSGVTVDSGSAAITYGGYLLGGGGNDLLFTNNSSNTFTTGRVGNYTKNIDLTFVGEKFLLNSTGNSTDVYYGGYSSFYATNGKGFNVGTDTAAGNVELTGAYYFDSRSTANAPIFRVNNGTYTVNNGTVTLAYNAKMLIGNNTSVADAEYVQTGGLFKVKSTSSMRDQAVYIGYSSQGTMSLSGGTFSLGAYGDSSASGNAHPWVVGVCGDGTLNINSGMDLVTAPNLQFNRWDDSIGTTDGNGTVNLSGGTLNVGYVARNTAGSGAATLNFNGGALQAATDTTTFMQGLTHAYVKSGGAVIDTNGYNITIAQDLVTGETSTDGGLTKDGLGTLTLSGTNTYTGTTTVNAGVLIGASTSALAGYNTAGRIEVKNGAALGVFVGSSDWSDTNLSTLISNATWEAGSSLALDTTNGDFTYTNNMSGSLGLVKTGANTLTLTGPTTYTGATTVSEGALLATGTASLANFGSSSTIAVADGATLAVRVGGASFASTDVGSLISANGSGFVSGSALGLDTTNGDFTHATAITGNMGLAKLGDNTLTLSGANTYTGATTVEAGTLQVGVNDALTTTTGVNVATSAVLDVNGFAQTIGSLAGNGSVTLGSGTLTVGDSNDTAYAGNISGAGGYLVKQGDGTLTLSGTNSHTGATIVNAGTLAPSTAASLPGYNTSSKVIVNTGALAVNAGGSGWAYTEIDALSTNATWNTGSTLAIDTTNAGGTLSSAVGAYSLTKSGDNTLTLAAAAGSHAGTTTINGGTLQLGVTNAVSTANALVMSNSNATTFDLNGYDQTIASLSGGLAGSPLATISLGANTLTVGDSTNTTFSGMITSTTGGLTKQGTGSLTLYPIANDNTGDYTYGGATTINAGTLSLPGGSFIQSNILPTDTALVLANNATATLNIGGNNRTLTVASLSGGGSAGGNVVLGNEGGLIIDGNANTTYAGVISGLGAASSSGLTLNGGTLTLTGANTYTSYTHINGGTLRLSGGTNRLSSVLISFANDANAILDLDGNNHTFSYISGGGTAGGNIALGGATLTLNGTSGNYNGAITGNGSLVKTSTNVAQLGGANTYTGATTISDGTIRIVGDNALPATTAVSIANTTATLDVNGCSQTIGSLAGGGEDGGYVFLSTETTGGTLNIGGTASTRFGGVIWNGDGGTASTCMAGSLVKSGSGTLTLSNDGGTWGYFNAYTGMTTVSGGVLAYGSTNVIYTGGLTVSGGTVAMGSYTDSVGAVTLESGAITGTNTLTSTSGFEMQSGTAGVKLAGSVGLTKTGTGTALLTGANTYTGTTTVLGGILELGSSAQSRVLTGAGADIQGGKIVFDYTSTAPDVGTLLNASFTGGTAAWTTGQFRSTTADSTHGLGWIDNGIDQVTVMYTLYGDSNCDGSVNGTDLNAVLSYYNQSSQIWNHGDFNYDGSVNGTDLNTVLSNYNQSLSSATAAVPEPSTLLLMLLGLAGLLAWRKARACTQR